MKDAEDEAFDDLAKRQGHWGGGFKAKSEAAAARFKDGVQWWMDTETYGACPNPPQWHIDTGNLVRLVPQRPWVGLTDEEIAQGNKESWVDRQAFESAVWWASEKLKEKNGV